MLEAVSLERVMRAWERRLQVLRGILRDHAISPAEFHRGLGDLELAYELAGQLLSHGFDELYILREGETTAFRDGWLPLHGSDLLKYLRALRAAGVHRSHIQRAGYYYFPSPRIVFVEGAVYVEWPEGVYRGYPIAYIRLDDASPGDMFTAGVEFSRVGQELMNKFRGKFRALLNTAYIFSVHDYLKVARRVCGYAVRLYGETGYPVQMLYPYLTAENTIYTLEVDWDYLIAGRLGVYLGYLRPYDPRYGPVLAPPKMSYDTPRVFELEGEDLLKVIGSIAGSGTLVHRGEDGSELYLLDTPRSERALRRALGRRTMEQLSHILPKIGTGLYLYVEGGGPGLYHAETPPPEYVATFFAAKALHLEGEFLVSRMEGLPSPLLSLFADKTSVAGRTVNYRIAAVPKKMELSSDYMYYDWETGVGIALY